MNDSNKIIVVGFQNLLSGEFHKTIYDNYTIYLPEYEEYILKKGDILITNSLDAKDVIIVQWDEEEFALPSSEIAVISPLKIENTELIINILKNDIKEHLHNIIKNDNDFTINNEINNKLKILNEQLSTILEIKKSLNIEKKRIEPNKIVKFKKEELDNVRPITRLKLNQEKILFLVERIKELMISKYFISNEDKEIIQDLINDLLEYDFNKINRIFENMRGLIQQENTHLNSDDSTFIVYELNSLLNNMQKYVSRIDLMKFGMLKDLRSLHMISKVQEEEVIESDETTQEFYNEEIFLKSIIEELSSLGKIIQKELYKDIIDDEVKFNAFKEFTRSLLHEYGQPITNIRFNIQQIMRRIKKGKILDNDFLIYSLWGCPLIEL
jgi:hypothetical protein